nr:enoyl-CoA hydratase/isomerase family protein [FCB group bacterium]
MNHILLEKKNRIAYITIDRPDKLNALNTTVMDELASAFEHAAGDNTVKAVILTGAGDKAFVAGADIKEIAEFIPETGREDSRKGQKIFNCIENMSKPVIAAVNGYALGGGGELAMACHIRIASENAKFGQPEISLGL